MTNKDPPIPDKSKMFEYFSEEQWDKMEEYEKLSYCNIFHNYMKMKSLGLNPTKPLFMCENFELAPQKHGTKRKSSSPCFVAPPKISHVEEKKPEHILSSSLVSEDMTGDTDIFTPQEKCLSIKLKNVFSSALVAYKEYQRHGRSSFLGTFVLLRRKLNDVKVEQKTQTVDNSQTTNHLSNKSTTNKCTHHIKKETNKDENDVKKIKEQIISNKRGDIGQDGENGSKFAKVVDNLKSSKDDELSLKKQTRSVQTQTAAIGVPLHKTPLVFMSLIDTKGTVGIQPPDSKYNSSNNKREDKSKVNVSSLSEHCDWDESDFKWSDELDISEKGKKVLETTEVNISEVPSEERFERESDFGSDFGLEETDCKNSERRYPRRCRLVVNYTEAEQLQDDEYIFCDLCDREYEGDCPVHGPHIIFHDNPVPMTGKSNRALLTTPPILQVTTSKIPGAGSGVWTEVGLPPHARLGPYQGVKTSQPDPLGYSWVIMKDKKVDHYIAANTIARSNWMRFVNCARHESEQNLMAFQYKGEIYYRTVARIPPKSELFVWYGKDYAQKLGISMETFRKPDTKHLKDLVFTCEKCNVTFTSPLYVESHEKSCKGKKKQLVRVDPDSVPEDVQSLARTVDGKKNYCCQICPYKTTYITNMRHHLLSHKGVRAYKCDVCHKAFTQAVNLTVHMRTHTGEKLYSCSECAYTCNQASSLHRHMCRHTGEKQYGCQYCSYKTAISSNFINHLRTHTGERPYACSECSFTCNQASSLRRHMHRHTGEKQYG